MSILKAIRERLDVALLEWGLTGKPVAYDVLDDLRTPCDAMEAGTRLRQMADKAEAEVEQWRAMAHEIGLADRPPAEMIDPIQDALGMAEDHWGCPAWCEPCGEQLASKGCGHCHGAGAMAADAYIECEGCAEKSYADLVSEAVRLESVMDRVRNALSTHPKACDQHADDDPISCGWKRAVADVEAALRGDHE